MKTSYHNLCLLIIFCLNITACSHKPSIKTDITPSKYTHPKDLHVYFKDDIFLRSNKKTQNPEVDILALNDGIRDSLDKNIRPIKNPALRLKALRKMIFSNDGLNIRYSSYPTKTAIEAYQSRAVNCISFANLFIAMGRYVNLPMQ